MIAVHTTAPFHTLVYCPVCPILTFCIIQCQFGAIVCLGYWRGGEHGGECEESAATAAHTASPPPRSEISLTGVPR